MSKCNKCLHIEACKQWYPKLPDKYHDGCEQFAAKKRWIPVAETLPDEKKIIGGEVYYRNVAVRVKNLLHERVAYYDHEHECWYDTGFFQIRGVTHWAELPAWEE